MSSTPVIPSSHVLTPDDFEFFWETSSVFSQWHKSLFVIDGHTYINAEQWMMASKARLHGDEVTLAKILKSKNARHIKEFGQEVTPFSEELWFEQCFAIVVQGTRAKFKQNASMMSQLLATGSRIIIESAPNDKRWGIGITREKAIQQLEAWNSDPSLPDPRLTWGTNLLGKALMQVREDERAVTATSA